jgi:hypothetical protein
MPAVGLIAGLFALIFRLILVGMGLFAAVALLLWGIARATRLLLGYQTAQATQGMSAPPAKHGSQPHPDVLDVEAREVPSQSTELPRQVKDT